MGSFSFSFSFPSLRNARVGHRLTSVKRIGRLGQGGGGEDCMGAPPNDPAAFVIIKRMR